ncbi:unnamed protein product [Clonostachys rosea f. rosea IK726]|uniref:Uncharacterized protein n=1 Tax=Clonostachys rosea f. rosea IK726 TaxID=1349383 RepID=A0ACA9UMV5_BIOOC|nr:unnamed protein product [Clonostachys rosea f. rosea IK726]
MMLLVSPAASQAYHWTAARGITHQWPLRGALLLVLPDDGNEAEQRSSRLPSAIATPPLHQDPRYPQAAANKRRTCCCRQPLGQTGTGLGLALGSRWPNSQTRAAAGLELRHLAAPLLPTSQIDSPLHEDYRRPKALPLFDVHV